MNALRDSVDAGMTRRPGSIREFPKIIRDTFEHD